MLHNNCTFVLFAEIAPGCVEDVGQLFPPRHKLAKHAHKALLVDEKTCKYRNVRKHTQTQTQQSKQQQIVVVF
jgi:N-acetyl-anhydromuramyl-L-alanine amidase AmpD